MDTLSMNGFSEHYHAML